VWGEMGDGKMLLLSTTVGLVSGFADDWLDNPLQISLQNEQTFRQNRTK
jgi:hypothetical protein